MTKIYRRLYIGIFSILIVLLIGNFFRTWWSGRKLVKPIGNGKKKAAALTTSVKKHDRSQYDVIVKRNLFANAGFIENESGSVSASNLPETKLRLRLASTVLSSQGKPLAVIEDQVKREQRIYREGDYIFIKGQKSKVKVAKIERFQVVLDRNGKQEVLKMFEKKTYTASRRNRPRYGSPRRRRPPRPVSRTMPEEIPLMGENSPEKLRGTSRSRSRETAVHETAKFYPVVEGSEVVGLRIRRVNPKGLYRRIGLIDGDIIRSVNGQPITDPSDVETLNEILKSREPIELEIKRRNRIIRKTMQNY